MIFRKRLANSLVGAGLGASAALVGDRVTGIDSPWLSGAVGGLVGGGFGAAITDPVTFQDKIKESIAFQKARHEAAMPLIPLTQMYGTPSFNAWLHPSLGAMALGGTAAALNSDASPLSSIPTGMAIGGTLGMALNRGMLYGAKFPRVYTTETK